MRNIHQLLSRFNAATGEIAGVPVTQRHLSDLRGCFFDQAAYQTALEAGDPVVYTVSTVESAHEPGDLHFGIGRIMPGRVGSEYYMTKGHLHAWREAAEIYIGLAGNGMMLLEDETDGETQLVPLHPEQAVYVPAHTAHRTINSGSVPLVYLGIYPARAGHDYGTIAERNFRKVLIERDARPVLLDRTHLTDSPAGGNTKGI
jgi:glucose-6-phosphate isomerase